MGVLAQYVGGKVADLRHPGFVMAAAMGLIKESMNQMIKILQETMPKGRAYRDVGSTTTCEYFSEPCISRHSYPFYGAIKISIGRKTYCAAPIYRTVEVGLILVSPRLPAFLIEAQS